MSRYLINLCLGPKSLKFHFPIIGYWLYVNVMPGTRNVK